MDKVREVFLLCLIGCLGLLSYYFINIRSSMRSYPYERGIYETELYFEASDFDPKGVLYVGRGVEFGDGAIYVSYDKGRTFNKLWSFPREFSPRNVRLVYVDSRGNLFVGGGNGTIFRSTDGGKSFELVLNLGLKRRDAEFWNMAETSNGTLFVTLHYILDRAAIYRSDDGGKTWYNVAPNEWGKGDTHDVAVGINDWIYVSKGWDYRGIWRSKDYGRTWHYIIRDRRWRLALETYGNIVFITTEDKINAIGMFIDDGSDGPFEPIILYEIGGKLSHRPFLWIRRVGDELFAGSACTGGAPGRKTSIIVYSPNLGKTWYIIDKKENSEQRRTYYFSTNHPERGGCIFSTKAPHNIRIST